MRHNKNVTLIECIENTQAEGTSLLEKNGVYLIRHGCLIGRTFGSKKPIRLPFYGKTVEEINKHFYELGMDTRVQECKIS